MGLRLLAASPILDRQKLVHRHRLVNQRDLRKNISTFLAARRRKLAA